MLKGVQDVYENYDPENGRLEIRMEAKNIFKSYRGGETLETDFKLKRPFKLICERPSTEIIVVYNGVVPLCCADVTWKEKMGNVNDRSLEDIWFSKQFSYIRESLLKSDRSCNQSCQQCDVIV